MLTVLTCEGGFYFGQLFLVMRGAPVRSISLPPLPSGFISDGSSPLGPVTVWGTKAEKVRPRMPGACWPK